MASEYNQTDVVGASYIRAYSIEIDYPDDKTPSAIMKRERVFVLSDGSKVREEIAPLRIPFDVKKVYSLLNPENGSQLGATITLFDVFVSLYSIFVAESNEAAAEALEDAQAEAARQEVLTAKFLEYINQFPEEERAAKAAEVLSIWPADIPKPTY